jgi:DNA polymerase III sliding clamp (beta) subunit (PCNA family)
MKLTIKQDVLINALDRGAMAALSDDAQSDTSIISLILKSVTIKTDGKNLTVESATKLLSSKFSIPVSKENGIEVKEDGEILVPAKELYDWTKRQQECTLALVLSKLDSPEIVNPLSSEASSTKGIKKIGTVKIMSKDDTKTGTKWNLDCYAPDQLGPSKIDLPKVKKFSMGANVLLDGFGSIDFSAMPTHYEHIFDSISFQKYNDKLFMLTFDSRRIASFEITSKENNLDMSLLIPHKILGTVAKLANKEADISFYYDGTANKAYIFQDANGIEFSVKLSTTDPDKAKKFAPIAVVEGFKYKKICSVSRASLINRLSTSTMVNNEANLLSLKSDKMTIYSASIAGKAPVTCVLPVKDLSIEYKVVACPTHIAEVMKALKDDYVDIMIKGNEDINKSFKFISQGNKAVTYYIINTDVSKSKYNNVVAEE